MEEKYDDNLLIGFFASIANFSREALETEVKFIDLGRDNKLILEPKPDDQIFGAAIVSSKDNNELVSKILRNFLQDFTDEFSPDYDISMDKRQKMEELITENLRGKRSYSLLLRFIGSWLILIPLLILLTAINIWATEFLIIRANPSFFTINQILTRTFPQIVLFSFAELVIVFGISNFISGYITMDLRIGFLNSIIFFILILISYFLSVQPVLVYIILAFLPFIIIASLGGAYLGYLIAIKRRLT